jgi:hypothetical protein
MVRVIHHPRFSDRIRKPYFTQLRLRPLNLMSPPLFPIRFEISSVISPCHQYASFVLPLFLQNFLNDLLNVHPPPPLSATRVKIAPFLLGTFQECELVNQVSTCSSSFQIGIYDSTLLISSSLSCVDFTLLAVSQWLRRRTTRVCQARCTDKCDEILYSI